jgi:hypothetical protein
VAEKKGRPTPKRSEVLATKKKPLVAPKGREAQRASRKDDAARRAAMREAMKTGDLRSLPPLLASPERVLVRDVVDSRRSLALLAVPGWIVGMAMNIVPIPAVRAAATIVLLLLVAVVVGDTLVIGRKVRAALAERFPGGTKEPAKRLARYGMVRNTQFRRRRLPPPRVKVDG